MTHTTPEPRMRNGINVDQPFDTISNPVPVIVDFVAHS